MHSRRIVTVAVKTIDSQTQVTRQFSLQTCRYVCKMPISVSNKFVICIPGIIRTTDNAIRMGQVSNANAYWVLDEKSGDDTHWNSSGSLRQTSGHLHENFNELLWFYKRRAVA